MNYATKKLLESGDLRGFQNGLESSVSSTKFWQSLIVATGTLGCFVAVFERWWLPKDTSSAALIDLVISELPVLAGAMVLVGTIRGERKIRRKLAEELWRALGDQTNPDSPQVAPTTDDGSPHHRRIS